jgi:hypothetical protein
MRKHRCSTGAGTMQANASICKHRCSTGAGTMQANASICKHTQASMQERCRRMQAYASTRKHRCRNDAGECKHTQASMQANASIDAEECKHAQASMQHGCCTGAGTMQKNASTRKHRCSTGAARVQERCRRMQAYASIDAARVLHGCRNDAGAARVQERCRCCTGAGTMQERCCIDAEGANAGFVSMLCTHSIALHAGESGIDGAGKRNMLAVCLHCLHFSEQRITARRGGKRGVTGEMRGIVRRVPTCGAVRRRRLRPIRVRCSFLDSRGTMELAAREAVAEVAFPPRKAWIETTVVETTNARPPCGSRARVSLPLVDRLELSLNPRI